MSDEVAKTIKRRSETLVAKPISRDDRVARLNEKLGEMKRPVLFVDIDERHVGRITIDPAAETEITLYCTETGFKVVDTAI